MDEIRESLRCSRISGARLGSDVAFRRYTWTAVAVVGSGILGAGASIYGANKQAGANAAAQDQSIAAQKESERQNWIRYLQTRGINAGPDTRSGEIPGVAAGAPINTKLPLWMNVVAGNRGTGGATAGGAGNTPFLLRKGGT